MTRMTASVVFNVLFIYFPFQTFVYANIRTCFELCQFIAKLHVLYKFKVMKRIILLYSLVLMMFTLNAFSQTIPVDTRFGKVSREEIELSVYPADTSASALILYENTRLLLDFNAAGNFEVHTEKHVRIKILKEEGVDYGDVEMLSYDSQGLYENIRGIEVVTYNMEDGKVESTKMPKKYIFTEDYNQSYKKVSFSAQEVRVGSVVEFKYETNSNIYWEIEDIYLQRDIPVNLTECTVRLSEMLTFNKKQLGFHPVSHEGSIDNSSFSLGGGEIYRYDINVDKYRATDIPAFKEEPYLYNADQYYTALHYDIRSLTIPGSVYEDYSVTWDDVDRTYLESDMMIRFKGQCQFKDEIKALMTAGEHPQVIASVVKLVKDNVQWDNRYKIMPEPLAQIVKSRSGSNADINCLIAGCLREMGYKVDPVLVKLRTSGYLLTSQPERNPYDTFILKVTDVNGKSYYLDGGAAYGYVNILNPVMLVENARVLTREGSCYWVDLTRLCRNSIIMQVKAEISSDLQLTGKVNAIHTGQDSYQLKRSFQSKDEERFIESIESELLSEVTDFKESGLQEYSSGAGYEYSFVNDQGADPSRLYINPFVTKFHSASSLQSIKRDYPVDFPYPYTIRYTFEMPVPEGYMVEQMPDNVQAAHDGLDAVMRLTAKEAGKVIQLLFTYTQNNMIGQVEDYPDIRDFWMFMAERYDSMIVLKKL